MKDNNYLKDCFIKYEKVRRSGKYNMITESSKAAKKAGLSLQDYMNVIRNYNTLYKKYGGK